MSNWSDGYLTAIDYINHYSAKMNINYLTVPFLMNNLSVPEIKTCCELGFGQGYNIVVNGKATTTQWYGTDFLPSQVLNARKLNELGGKDSAETQLFDESFAEFCQRDDLPDFDMIVFHGIWSWISDENRQIIIDFIRRKLKVGGVVYASYNVLPAWSQNLPLKQMLTTQYKLTPTSLNIEERIRQALNKVNELVACSPSFKRNNPVLMECLQSINQKKAAYIAHEYLNEHLKPMYFDEVANLFNQAKLTFACSEDYFNNADEWILNETQLAFLKDIDDPIFREVQKDTMLMRWFRRDYWVKGADKLSNIETLNRWKQVRVVLMKEHENINPIYKNISGSIKFDQAQLQALLNILKDYKIHTVGEIIDALSDKYHHDKVIQLVALLVTNLDIAVAQPKENINAVKQRCLEFNSTVLNRIFEPNAIKFLISPVTAQLIEFEQTDLLLIKAISEKVPLNKRAEWMWQYMKEHNRIISNNDQTALNKDESIQLLTKLMDNRSSLQKLVQALQIV